MSKVRINDLARELEVKPRAIIDLLPEIGVEAGKTHSSSLEGDEAEKVRAHFAQDAKSAGHGAGAPARHGAQPIVPKIDLSHISKPGDVMKAILAKKKEAEEESRHAHAPARPAVTPPAAKVAAPVVPGAVEKTPVAAGFAGTCEGRDSPSSSFFLARMAFITSPGFEMCERSIFGTIGCAP